MHVLIDSSHMELYAALQTLDYLRNFNDALIQIHYTDLSRGLCHSYFKKN